MIRVENVNGEFIENITLISGGVMKNDNSLAVSATSTVSHIRKNTQLRPGITISKCI